MIKISDVFTLPLVSKKFLGPVLAERETGGGWWDGSARPGLMRSYYADGAGQEILPRDKWEEMLLK